MTSFCLWFDDDMEYRNFLSERISSANELIVVATKFVSFNEWLGSGIEYEVVLRKEEFSFAISPDIPKRFLSGLTVDCDFPPYEVSNRADTDLTKDQLRDFAIRQLLNIYTFD